MRQTRFPIVAALLLSAAIVAAAFYGKLSANLHSENFNIGSSLWAGKGFANAMGPDSGPSAWVAPGYPTILASLLWLGDGSRTVVVTGIVILQVCVLVATGLLVLALAWQTIGRIGAGFATVLFSFGLLHHFWFWFELVHDCWLMLLALDILLAGFCWLWPVSASPPSGARGEGGWTAAAWGLIGGLVAMTNPILGFAWGVLTLAPGLRSGAWSRPALAILVAGLMLTPWMIRNYLAFGRLMPVKSNLAYEMYQAQCLMPNGLLHGTAFQTHPANANSREHDEYRHLGEAAFLDRKWQQFAEAVRAAPQDFLDRTANRFLAATVWYVPHRPLIEERQPWSLWARRLAHPLPFLALLTLIFTGIFTPLGRPQWTVIGLYGLYLLPYLVASYYERYTVPLLPLKVLLVLWAGDRLLRLRQKNEQFAIVIE